MTIKQLVLLLFISALWGGSFIFMKILTPVFGPVMTSSFRLLIASGFLYVYFLVTKHKIIWRQSLKFFVIVGILNSAIPFVMYSFASSYIDASLSVILNSTSPMFGAVFGFIILKEKLNLSKSIGLIIGSFGVFIVSSFTIFNGSINTYLAIAACIIAAMLYGYSGNYVKKNVQHLDSKTLTFGSLLFGGLSLLPFSFFHGIEGTIDYKIILLFIFFGVMSTAVTYIIYYKLIKEIGAMKALTVTYLMPIFGVLWAYLFLNEIPSVNIYIGSVVILFGVFLVTTSKLKQKSGI